MWYLLLLNLFGVNAHLYDSMNLSPIEPSHVIHRIEREQLAFKTIGTNNEENNDEFERIISDTLTVVDNQDFERENLIWEYFKSISDIKIKKFQTIFISLIVVIANILLLIGLLKNKHKFMAWSYLIFALSLLIYLIFSFVPCFNKSTDLGKQENEYYHRILTEKRHNIKNVLYEANAYYKNINNVSFIACWGSLIMTIVVFTIGFADYYMNGYSNDV